MTDGNAWVEVRLERRFVRGYVERASDISCRYFARVLPVRVCGTFEGKKVLGFACPLARHFDLRSCRAGRPPHICGFSFRSRDGNGGVEVLASAVIKSVRNSRDGIMRYVKGGFV